MSDNLTIEIDFTGITPASGGLGYLTAGLHTGTIVEFNHFEDSNRLYLYADTSGVRHRDSFSLASDGGKAFLLSMLTSAGVPPDKLAGKSKIPFDKLAGKTVYFNYVPPEMGSNGKPVQGSYPRYTYYTKDRYVQMQEVAAITPQDVEVTAENGGGSPIAQAATKNDDDFSFLVDDTDK